MLRPQGPPIRTASRAAPATSPRTEGTWQYPPPRCTHPEEGNACRGCHAYTPPPSASHSAAPDPPHAPAPLVTRYTITAKTWRATIHVNAAGKIVQREGALRRDLIRHQSWQALRTAVTSQLKHYTITREKQP